VFDDFGFEVEGDDAWGFIGDQSVREVALGLGG
jgi:hypothetical protein